MLLADPASANQRPGAPGSAASPPNPRRNALPPPLRVALIADFLEEGWPSMDLVAAELRAHLPTVAARNLPGRALSVETLQPAMWLTRRRVENPPAPSAVARLLNRFGRYPWYLRGVRGRFDLFHIVDHSYAHLALALPPGRTVVTCHDLDTFRCLLEPTRPPRRGPGFRWMTGRILAGLRRAAHVCCVSAATRDAVLAHGLAPADRVSVTPNGVQSPLLDPVSAAAGESALDRALAAAAGRVGVKREFDLLHVGSNVPRKRLDTLLALLAQLRASRPGVRLLRVGDPFTPAQAALAARLGVADAVTEIPRLTGAALGAAYRRAALVLQPSEAEGFGLPVIESLACGTPVLASDLLVLREIGGEAAEYAPVADAAAWAQRVCALLEERARQPAAWEARRERCRRQGARFTWRHTARLTAEIYGQIAARCRY